MRHNYPNGPKPLVQKCETSEKALCVFPESCMGRCENGFDSARTCQCDSMCKYYKSCCSDYEVTCAMMSELKTINPRLSLRQTGWCCLLARTLSDQSPILSLLPQARGDSFVYPEEDYDDKPLEGASPSPIPSGSRRLRPTREPLTDFGRRPHQHQDAALDMIRPPRPLNPALVSIPSTPTDPPADDLTTQAPEAHSNLDVTTTVAVTTGTTEAPDPDAEVCSGRPFDAFMQIKNGSIFAFRGELEHLPLRDSLGSSCVTFFSFPGEYFFELDHKSVLPGYPKLIRDVWGIDGPVDTAFTRYNCQGKTYIFKVGEADGGPREQLLQ